MNEGAVLRFKGTWMRLTRRAVRDYNFRGTGVAETLEMWANVRRGEKLYISPFKGRADIIFDSSLPYEVPVMKNYAIPILRSVPQENERHDEMLQLVDAFQHFEAIDPALVPKDSLRGSHRRWELPVSLTYQIHGAVLRGEGQSLQPPALTSLSAVGSSKAFILFPE